MQQQHTHSIDHHARSLGFCVVGQSTSGRFLTQNDDAFLTYAPANPHDVESRGKLYLIADGTGDHEARRQASQIAAETIPAAYYASREGKSPLAHLQQAFFAAHQCIRAYAKLHPEVPEITTTCTAVVVKGRQLYIAHIGDSRAYLVHPISPSRSTISRLTTDHSVAAALVRAGILAPERLRASSQHDMFLRALGGRDEMLPYPDFVMPAVRPGDRLVLCSDGLWSAVSEEQIASIVSSVPVQRACEQLVQLADERGGHENISVIVLSFYEEDGR